MKDQTQEFSLEYLFMGKAQHIEQMILQSRADFIFTGSVNMHIPNKGYNLDMNVVLLTSYQ